MSTTSTETLYGVYDTYHGMWDSSPITFAAASALARKMNGWYEALPLADRQDIFGILTNRFQVRLADADFLAFDRDMMARYEAEWEAQRDYQEYWQYDTEDDDYWCERAIDMEITNA